MKLVRLALEEEGSIAALARKHDINHNLLFKWIRLIDGKVWRTVYYRLATLEERERQMSTNLIVQGEPSECRDEA
ncbi:transposase [Escherichia fergusonii]|nr:transposase [Escherichia fergusonii]MBY7443966.1 transposase [Escherichia fergusonii]MBY7556742.1 transposase [Escherichia fergusonii]MCH5364619.1 transposase [Escherichia fergusonii]HCO5014325.1 transposase [Escherichia fergusonii]